MKESFRAKKLRAFFKLKENELEELSITDCRLIFFSQKAETLSRLNKQPGVLCYKLLKK